MIPESKLRSDTIGSYECGLKTNMMARSLVVVLAAWCAAAVKAGCTDGGSGGCGVPVGEKWDQWSMRASTYTCVHEATLMSCRHALMMSN